MLNGQKYNTGLQLKELNEKFGTTIFVKDNFNCFGLYGERIYIRPCPSGDAKYHQIIIADVLGREWYAASYDKKTGARALADDALLSKTIPVTWRRDRPRCGCPLQLLEIRKPFVAEDIADRVEHYINLAHEYHIAAPTRLVRSI